MHGRRASPKPAMVLDDGSYVLFHLAHHEACFSAPPVLFLLVPFARAPASRIYLYKRKLCPRLYLFDLNWLVSELAKLPAITGKFCEAAKEAVDIDEIAIIANAPALSAVILVMIFLPKIVSFKFAPYNFPIRVHRFVAVNILCDLDCVFF